MHSQKNLDAPWVRLLKAGANFIGDRSQMKESGIRACFYWSTWAMYSPHNQPVLHLSACFCVFTIIHAFLAATWWRNASVYGMWTTNFLPQSSDLTNHPVTKQQTEVLRHHIKHVWHQLSHMFNIKQAENNTLTERTHLANRSGFSMVNGRTNAWHVYHLVYLQLIMQCQTSCTKLKG